ncbi:hypothetical protein GCM10023149_27650 [Mucilaginibacter gynuensis]|uniref:Peptidyl-prolyl cis-trans isomerase n=1 Tax=Mucilaginibacter gynuensis TaxID=1302236 RepID=A0ABP8GJ86_9SPHI
MKKYLLVLLVALTSLSACKKDKFDAAKQAETDENIIKKYLTDNGITATRHSSGLYYKIITEGTGANATSSSTVTVNYVGILPSGSQFDKNNGITFPLTNVIQGWQIGIPLVKTGGRIQLFVPSALGYAQKAQSGIPANSVLIFTVDLLSIN